MKKTARVITGRTQLSPSGIKGLSRKLPFEGLRVMEFTVLGAGPLVGKLLADFGAQGINVESMHHLKSHVSSWQPAAKGGKATSLNVGRVQNKYGTNKLSVTLNLTSSKGIAVAKRLIQASDVVIDSFSPHTVEQWGLSYDEVRNIRPDIIMLRMPAMGLDGPHRDHRAYSWTLTALCGLNYMTGFADSPPINAGPMSYPDASCTPFHAATALLAALYYRAKTGRGQLIELSQYESAVCITETGIFSYLANGKQPCRPGNRLDYAAPHGVYRCKGDDRWCAIAVFAEEEWKAFCSVLGREELANASKFATLLLRKENETELDQLIEEWTEQRSAEEIMELMQEAGVAASVVQNSEDLFAKDPQLKERGHWKMLDHPEAGKTLAEAWGFRLSAISGPLWGRAPLLGEHNDYVMGEVLGMTEEEVNQLIVEGVID